MADNKKMSPAGGLAALVAFTLWIVALLWLIHSGGDARSWIAWAFSLILVPVAGYLTHQVGIVRDARRMRRAGTTPIPLGK